MTPDPALIAATATAAFAVVGAGVWRRHRGALGDRDEVVLLPTQSFDPTLEEVRRWAAAVHATRRRRDWARRRGEGVRFALTGAGDSSVVQRLGASRRALAQLEPATPHQVELLRPEPKAEGPSDSGTLPEDEERPRRSSARRGGPPRSSVSGPRFRARAELYVTPSQTHALAELDLKPDPLTPLVAALGELASGESATVALDLMPLSGLGRRSALAKARRRDRDRPDWAAQLTSAAWLNQDPLSRSPVSKATTATAKVGALARLENRSATMTDHDRFASGDPVFRVQMLIWADAPTKRRARAIVATLVGALAPMHQRAQWARLGRSVGSWWIGGADGSARRRRFDHRALTGCHHPVRGSCVGATEIAALLKPPTVHCHAPNAQRGGGLVPPPPPGLPDWTTDRYDLFPLGVVRDRGVERRVGVPLADTFFTASFGRSRYGKTEKALVAMVHLAHVPDTPNVAPAQRRPGILFCDPHGDGITRLVPYLLDQADRILEVNLSRAGSATQAGWNPLDMTGLGPPDVEGVVSMMAAAFAATLGWTEKNNRGLNLVTQSVSSLCQLGLQLPPGLQPTIFQMVTILADDAWRGEILRFLSPHQRSFWTTRFAKQTGGGEAITPVTNLLDRLRASAHVAALFGQPRSTFNMRAAMDAGRIILLCPGGAEDKEQLIHALFLFELFRSTTSRRDVDHPQRRLVHAFLDELQVADRGQSSELVARMLQECAKYGLRLHGLVQQPTSLSKETLNAISTNRSHLFTTTVNHESAGWLRHEFADQVDPVTLTQIRRYHCVTSVTLDGSASAPFRMRGLALPEVYGPPPDADAVEAIERAVDVSMNRQSVASVLAGLDLLDGRILAYLRGTPGPTPGEPPAAPPPPARRRRPPVTPAPVAPVDAGNVAYIDRARRWRPE